MDNFDAEIIEWVIKGGPQNPEFKGHPFRGNQIIGFGPRTLTPEMHERRGDFAMEDAQKMQASERAARAAGDHASAARLHDGATKIFRGAVGSYRAAAHAEKEASARAALGAHTVGDYPGHPFRGNQYTKSVDEVVEKGDFPGHEFHGNQWTSGESGKVFDNYRPADINQTISQIGKMNILGISGGRVNPLRNTAGEPVGVHLPVGKGYGVNVLLHPNDTYTVQRVTTRSGVVKIKGQEDGIYAEDLGDTAYRAGMYVNVPFGDHKGTLG